MPEPSSSSHVIPSSVPTSSDASSSHATFPQGSLEDGEPSQGSRGTQCCQAPPLNPLGRGNRHLAEGKSLKAGRTLTTRPAKGTFVEVQDHPSREGSSTVGGSRTLLESALQTETKATCSSNNRNTRSCEPVAMKKCASPGVGRGDYKYNPEGLAPQLQAEPALLLSSDTQNILRWTSTLATSTFLASSARSSPVSVSSTASGCGTWGKPSSSVL